jgi:predicted acetyltransferase
MKLCEIMKPVSEVKTIVHTDSDEKELTELMKSMLLRKAGTLQKVTTFGNIEVVTTKYGYNDVFFFLVDNTPIGFAKLDKRPIENIKSNRVVRIVSLIFITAAYRRSGLGFKFYNFLLNKYDLLTDTMQTQAAQNLWNKLGSLSGYETVKFGDRLLIKKTTPLTQPPQTVPNTHTRHVDIIEAKQPVPGNNVHAKQGPVEATSENINKAKSFLLDKWKERWRENHPEGETFNAKNGWSREPSDLSGSCKFSSMFAQRM